MLRAIISGRPFRLAERLGKIVKIRGSKPTLFWVGSRGFVHLQGTPYDNSGKISLMCLKMARSRGPKSSKFVGELWVFSRMGQKPNRSASLVRSFGRSRSSRSFTFLLHTRRSSERSAKPADPTDQATWDQPACARPPHAHAPSYSYIPT